jgi:hypothetical protein
LEWSIGEWSNGVMECWSNLVGREFIQAGSG